MTTPAILNRTLDELRARIESAKQNAAESSGASLNSFGAGYDQGYLDALTEIYAEIMGELPPAHQPIKVKHDPPR